MSDDKNNKKSSTTVKVDEMQKDIDKLEAELHKSMAEKILQAIPPNLRTAVLLGIVGIGGLGGGGSFMGYVNAQNPASTESHSVILEIRTEQKVQGKDLQHIKTEQKVMGYAIESVQEDVKTNTEDIKELLSK